MPTQATIQAKVNYGLGKAASVLGANCAWYRAQGAVNPLALANQLGTLTAYFRPPSGPFVNPAAIGKPAFYGTFDPTDVEIGDYLVEPEQGTFYVALLDPITYPLCVRCNRTLSVSRPGAAAAGPNYYGGDVTASETPLMTGWPGSLLIKSRGSGGETKLPGDVRLGYFEALLPAAPGVDFEMGDTIVDDTGARYTVSAAELSAIGWRMTAEVVAP